MADAEPSRVSTNIALQPPGKFNFKNPDGWIKWKRRFQQFMTASCLDRQEDDRKIRTMLYCLGDDAEEVLTSTSISAEQRKIYDQVLEKFDEFFKVRRNVIYERARFNKRDQKTGESSEAYITELYKLIESCEYGLMKDELLRDRLVVGILDKKLSEQLQMDAELTIEKAKKVIRQREAVREQSTDLLGKSDQSAHIEVVRERHSHSKRSAGKQYQQTRTHKGGAKISSHQRGCMRCGKRHPTRDQCPAKRATCHKCNRVGHYASVCLSKTVAAIEDEASDDVVFLDVVTTDEKKVWLKRFSSRART